ncbi:MAG TPA: hypothetical protein VG755_42260 [Nannocystaceae bacterium]|nr:hypothetical protein [Nannocystaceae bacterium]
MTPADPRWSLAVPSSGIAVALAWAAAVLPWHGGTSFGIATWVLALAHATTVVLCVAHSRHRRRAWQVQSFGALAYLSWIAYAVVRSAAQLDALYGELGRGVAIVLFAGGIVLAALLVPTAVWCVATTLRAHAARPAGVGAAIVVLGFAIGIARARAAVVAEAKPGLDRDALVTALPTMTDGASAMTSAPAVCAASPSERAVTILAAFATDDGAATACVQADAEAAAIAELQQLLVPARGRIALDVVTATRPLAEADPVVDLFAIRPGLDGVCEGPRCFAPWQLVALHAFAATAPLELLHELRFGFDPRVVGVERIAGLVRIETASFATDAHGELHELHRLRVDDHRSPEQALRAAEDYLARAQQPDGRFEYLLEPFSGESSMEGFSIARHAGTTFVLCELAEDRERARAIATRALAALAAHTHHEGELAMLGDAPGDPPPYDLGDAALGAIAYASCRPLVGDRFDDELAALARFLLAMQRDDGSFHPQYDGGIVRGPEPLFAVGQAVLALVLLEPMRSDRFPPHADIVRAVQAAMDHVAHDYWSGFGADFFYMEENWHCLAARAALPHHRHDGYERFCLDYARWKSRLVFDASDGVAPDLVGGYGFGNLVLPWTAGSATFGETAAAALAIADARGEDREPIATRLRLALAFLVHHQWKDAECFACSASHPIAGAWSEHPGSPTIRIDHVQHAMAALGAAQRLVR